MWDISKQTLIINTSQKLQQQREGPRYLCDETLPGYGWISLPECQPILLANPVEVIGDLRINSRITWWCTPISPANDTNQRITSAHPCPCSLGHQGSSTVALTSIHTPLRQSYGWLGFNRINRNIFRILINCIGKSSVIISASIPMYSYLRTSCC